MAPSSLAQWFGAVGTIAAVVVALFKDWIVAWGRKPRLDVTCQKEAPWTCRVPYVVSDRGGTLLWKGDRFWVRAKVENHGKTRAEKVQVYASKLEKSGLDNKFADIQTFLPLNMKWSYIGVTILDGISPDMGAFCDMVALYDPTDPYKPSAAPNNETVGELQLEAMQPDGLLPPGRYKLTLRIAAANARPIERVLEFEHTGKWRQDDTEMRRDHLAVSMK